MSDQQTKDMSTLLEVAKILGQIGTVGAGMYVGAGAARETYDALKAKCREMMDKLDEAQRQLDDIDPRDLDAEMRSDPRPLDAKSAGAHGFYSGAHKSWWNPFSSSTTEDSEPEYKPDVTMQIGDRMYTDEEEFFSNDVVRELADKIDELTRDLDDAEGNDRRKIRDEIDACHQRLASLQATMMKLRSREGRSAG